MKADALLAEAIDDLSQGKDAVISHEGLACPNSECGKVVPNISVVAPSVTQATWKLNLESTYREVFDLVHFSQNRDASMSSDF